MRLLMAALLSCAALAAFSVVAAPSTNALPEAASGVLSPRLAGLLASADAGDTLLVWIFLRDLGPGGGVASRRATISPRAAVRTSLRGSVESSAGDEPPFEGYIEDLRPFLLRMRHRSRYFNAISAEARAADLSSLATLPFVRLVDVVDVRRRPIPRGEDVEFPAARPDATPPVPPSPYGGSASQLEQIGAATLLDDGWNGSGARGGGEPVLVAILDTGYRLDHVALRGADVEAQWDFIQDDSVTANEAGDSPFQDMHGTTVLGVIGGYDYHDHMGPAWGARYLLAKSEIYETEIRVEEDHWIAAIEWADSAGADVVTSSLGYIAWYAPEDLDGETALCTRAADIAAAHGIVVVNSAGNRGYAGLVAPADGDSVIAVGGVDEYGAIVSFSSRGPTADGRVKPDFVARGSYVQSVAYGDTISYAAYSGTSYAAPLIAGICAQLLEAHPDWGPMKLRDALRATSSKGGFPDNDYGYGIPNAAIALSYPEGFGAGGAFPNPFMTATRLQLVSPALAPATVRVYDCRGALVRTIVSGGAPLAADWSVSWDGTNDAGERVASGIYFIVAKSAELDRICKVVLVR